MLLLGVYWLNLSLGVIPQIAKYPLLMPLVTISSFIFFIIAFLIRIKNKYFSN